MPTNHAAKLAFPIGSAASQTQARNALVGRYAYVLDAASEALDLVALDPDTGATIPALVLYGRTYYYDASDVVSAHDGTTVLVSYEGKRYKLAAGTDIVAYSVIDITTATPPVSPSVGDRYLVASGATGDWAGHVEEVAIYTARGWEFEEIAVGRFIYDEDTDSYYHKKANGDIIVGFGTQTLQANTHPVSALIGKPVRWIIINQTTDAPPGTPTTGDTYIIGSSPTGAWAGNAGAIAICEVGTTFTIYSPRTGERAYDQALEKELLFTGSAWVAANDGSTLIYSAAFSAVATIDIVNGTDGVVLDDTYDEYEISIISAKPVTDDVEAWLRLGTGGGPTWQTASYQWQSITILNGGSSASSNTSDAKIVISTQAATNDVGNAAGENFQAVLRFRNPDASDICAIRFDAWYHGAANGRVHSLHGSGHYNSGVAITGFRFLFETGNISSARVSLRGFRK